MAPVPVTTADGTVPRGNYAGRLPWGCAAAGRGPLGDLYCPACTSSRDWLTERTEPCEDDERCQGCGHTAAAIDAAQLEAFRAQQREWSRHSSNPITEDGLPLPTGVRGLIRVF